MTKTILGGALGLLVLGAVAAVNPVLAAGKPAVYEGIITQVNQADGSFVMRLRDGSMVSVPNPFQAGVFLSLKGILSAGSLDQLTEVKMKDAQGADAIPAVTVTDPGSGQVGTRITLTGTGFTKKNNSIRVGTVNNAVTGLTSRDGKTLSFIFPAAPCDQKGNKKNCAQKVLDPGVYSVAVTNTNGVSNDMPFQILPLPRLGITTEVLPQILSGKFSRLNIQGIGGAESYTWRLLSGAVPPGMRFAQAACKDVPCKSDGVAYGTPTTPGTYDFTVDLLSGAEEISRSYQITVVQSLAD